MEFFDLISIPQFFMQYFGPESVASIDELIGLYLNIRTVSLYVAAGLYLVCLLFGGFGMLAMAKKVGLGHAWMGFVPFLNTYYAGRLAGETRMFNQKMKRPGLYAMLAEILYVAFNVFALVIRFILTDPAYYAEVELSDGSTGIQFDESLLPTQYRWMVTADLVCSIVSYLIYFVLVFFMCVLFFAFFRKYYARGPFLMTFLCAVLPLRGFVIFAVRNNDPVDYDAWMRRRMQEYARQQQQMYGDMGGYGQGGYGQSGYDDVSSAPQEDPFPDYKGGSGGTPQDGDKSSSGSSGSSGVDDDPFPGF